jgi:Uma2 family endonuclease
MPSTAEIRRHLFSAKDYYRMGEAGILNEDDRVELIEGEIIEMPPIGSPHGGVVKTLISLLRYLPKELVIFGVQDPLDLDDRSQPEPDFMILLARHDNYRTSHPKPQEVLLLVEVSDTTLAYDRGIKLPLYARAGVRETWIVDITSDTVETYRSPEPTGAYTAQSTFGRGEELSIEALSDVRLKVDDLLGPA